MKRDAPAFHRNIEPIAEVLGRLLADRSGDVLELASGTGQHIAALAPRFPAFTWRPSEMARESFDSIEAWCAETGASNLAAPIIIDAAQTDWSEAPRAVEILLSCNMIHIAPWAAAEGLFAGAGRLLAPSGLLILYGPFMQGGAHNSESNVAFDAWLKERDPSYGVRDIDDLKRLAAANGLQLRERIEMPANNATLVFARA